MKVILDPSGRIVKRITDVKSQKDTLLMYMVAIVANQKLDDDPNFSVGEYIKDNLE